MKESVLINEVVVRTVITILMGMALYSPLSFASAELYNSRCLSCHGDQAQGLAEKKTPRLAGQYDWYITKQMESFKSQKERKDPGCRAKGLSSSQIESLSGYLAALK